MTKMTDLLQKERATKAEQQGIRSSLARIPIEIAYEAFQVHHKHVKGHEWMQECSLAECLADPDSADLFHTHWVWMASSLNTAIDEVVAENMAAADLPERHWICPKRVDELPYGMWTLDDGTEILFSRGYRGTYRRKDGKVDGLGNKNHTASNSGQNYTERYFRDDGKYNPRTEIEWWNRCVDIELEFIAGGSVEQYIYR